MNRYNGKDYSSDILEYKISSDMINIVSSLSSTTGLAIKAKDSQNIYFFGGEKTRREIHRFNSATNVTIKLRTVLPSDVFYAAGVVLNQSTFIFSGRGGNILEFNLNSETVKIVADLSFRSGPVDRTASITDSTSNRVWLFPGSTERLTHRVIIFNLEIKLISNVHKNISIPLLHHTTAPVSTGRHGYIIGGI
jgi:hypothetical protein